MADLSETIQMAIKLLAYDTDEANVGLRRPHFDYQISTKLSIPIQ
jgi:hypothetical protein